MYNENVSSDATLWKLISFSKKCKRDLPGFDFDVHYSEDRYPDAIMFMTAEMKRNLIRYGDIMFLDAQNDGFNQLGWPYIGNIVHNNNHIVCLL